MIKELLILRHGHAQDLAIGEGAEGDFSRELRDKGKRNAQRIGVWLARNALHPDRVITSPAPRALRTAEKTIKTSGMDGDSVIQVKELYGANVQSLLTIIRRTPEKVRRLMVVGHNPGLEDLVIDLCPEGSVPVTKSGNVLPCASLAHLSFDGAWQGIGHGCGVCLDVIRPKMLPRLFPYPEYDSREERVRPAYYYRQSSVVPYRIHEGELQVLIVSSSKQKHWVIPKGIHDPGKTAQASAANEALEEAGVEGEVLEVVIGTYDYSKWDATCRVTVYPMRVTKVLSEAEWEENHRDRQWLPVDQAAATVLNDDVKRLITQLPAVLATIPAETSSQ